MRIRDDLDCEVTAVDRVTADIVELTLVPRCEEPLDFLPGQYVLLEDAGHTLAPRSYSIANAPRPDGELTLLVTRVAGGRLTTWIHDRLEPGGRISIGGPYGTFTDESGSGEPERPTLYLAAGSGLAPIRSLLEARLDRLPDGPGRAGPAGPGATTLIFSARTEADLIDRDRFTSLASRHDRFRYIRTLTREPGPGPHGRIPGLIESLCGDLSGHRVFIAGSPGFVSACATAVTAAGVPAGEVRTEVFFVEPRPWGEGSPSDRPARPAPDRSGKEP